MAVKGKAFTEIRMAFVYGTALPSPWLVIGYTG